MDAISHCHDPFLRGLDEREKTQIEQRLDLWGLKTRLFAERLDGWFGNFDSSADKRLALKVFHSLDYYSPNAFNTRLKQLYSAITRHLSETNNAPSDVILVRPDDHGDSAERHVYDIVKQWRLKRSQICTISELSSRSFVDPVFVLFNDTHGTGNQFLRDIWPVLKPYGEYKIYVLAIAIAEQALRRFREEMPRVHVIPYVPVVSAKSIFTGEDCDRLREIGSRVYPKHPMGYGDAALLTAYYFQCPNNTLPIVWANGSNNTVGGRSYEWSPLFPYTPKDDNSFSAIPDVERVGRTSAATPVNPAVPSLSYRYRIGLLNLDLRQTDLAELARSLNSCQHFFHFTSPLNVDLKEPRTAFVMIDGHRYLSVHQIGSAFFAQLDEFAVDAAACFTRFALAFVEGSRLRSNYFCGPSHVDSRFLFVSADQLASFSRAAHCSRIQGLVYILVSQLVVYFTDVGYHHETRECPMDFCQTRADMIRGLRRRDFCKKCRWRVDKQLFGALEQLLDWKIGNQREDAI